MKAKGHVRAQNRGWLTTTATVLILLISLLALLSARELAVTAYLSVQGAAPAYSE